MTLTEEQVKAAAERPDGLRLTDPDTNQEYVLLRADAFDRLRAHQYDGSPWTDDERDALRSEALDALGWEGMEAYQDDTP